MSKHTDAKPQDDIPTPWCLALEGPSPGVVCNQYGAVNVFETKCQAEWFAQNNGFKNVIPVVLDL